MKRKSSKKAQLVEDDSNGVEEQSEENGGAVEEVDETEESDEEPQKKRRSSKSNKKNVSFSKKGDDNDEDLDDFNEEPQEKKKKTPKSSKKNKKAKESKSEEESAPAENDDEEDEAQYEVEKVLDEKLIRGVRHYLIRWKGYEEESDTWEPEDTLSCQDLIKAFKEGAKEGAKKKTFKSPKGRKPLKKDVDPNEEWDENEDFEVEKILEVHFKKGGKREFLVVWKGYGIKDSSWEPEENMNCKDMIEKFMAKVEVAKNYEEKELRVNRKHVQRLTYNTPDSHRRLSKRNSNRERVQYHDAE